MRELISGGLTPRALAAWAGTDRLSALHAFVPQLAAREVTPAGAVLALLIAGAEVPVAKLGAIEFSLPELERLGVIERAGGIARALVAVLPIEGAVLVCDRLDAPQERDLVCWPDDSSYHLARSLPPRRCRRWLDLGCGSAFAMLARPDIAIACGATDLNPRAVRYARLGAQLSGYELEVFEGDLAVPPAWRGASDLVTCNAPLPDGGDPYRALWRTGSADFVERACKAAAAMAATGAAIVLHAALDALAPVVAELPGERVVVAYTPEDVRGFAIAWWQPDGERRLVEARRPLTATRPHLDFSDRAAALA